MVGGWASGRWLAGQVVGMAPETAVAVNLVTPCDLSEMPGSKREYWAFSALGMQALRPGCVHLQVVHNCVSWEGQSGSAIWQTAVVDPGTSGPDGGGPPAPAAGSGPGSPAPPPAGSTPQQATVQAAPTPAAEVMSANGSSNGNATAPTVPAAQLGDVSTAQPNTIRAVLTGVITTSVSSAAA